MSGRGKGSKGLGARDLKPMEFDFEDDIIGRLKLWVKTKGDDFLEEYKEKMGDRIIDEGAKQRYLESNTNQLCDSIISCATSRSIIM